MLSAAHMAEHAVLVGVVAPAVVLAWTAVGSARPRVAHPWLAWSGFVTAQWAFHLTPLLEVSQGSAVLHVVEHLAFLAVGVWFWVPVLGAGLGDPGRALYLFCAAPAIDLVGALLMARGDAGAGVTMIAGSLPIVAAAVAITWRWIVREHNRRVAVEGTRGAAS